MVNHRWCPIVQAGRQEMQAGKVQSITVSAAGTPPGNAAAVAGGGNPEKLLGRWRRSASKAVPFQ